MTDVVTRAGTEGDTEAFFAYLEDHLSDSGVGETPLFQPAPRNESGVTEQMVQKFSEGIRKELGVPGWVRFWLAFSGDRIVGHIDLRARPETYATHRALLGMGVDRSFRRVGLGSRLLSEVLAWAAEHSSLEYVDLRVVSTNAAARRLYARHHFETCGEIEDLFRIDGESMSSTLMVRRVVLAE